MITQGTLQGANGWTLPFLPAWVQIFVWTKRGVELGNGHIHPVNFYTLYGPWETVAYSYFCRIDDRGWRFVFDLARFPKSDSLEFLFENEEILLQSWQGLTN
jgi:hypothetical protein